MRWLALDVGSKRVGVAVCDEQEAVVTPLEPVPFRGAERLAETVAELVAERGIAAVVVGMPVTRAGGGRGEKRAAAVAEALAARGIDVATVDERGTTREAERLLTEAGVPRRRWEGVVDGVAARLILEAHLEARRRGEPRRHAAVDLSGGEC